MLGIRRERHVAATTRADRGDRSVLGTVRAVPTLLGVAGAGALIWLASYSDLARPSGFWTAMGLIAGAGLVLGLSQILGGWTKWGAPRISPGMLLLAFLPTAIATGWVLIASQPAGGWQQERLAGWSEYGAFHGLVTGLGMFPAALAMGLGLVFAFSFDTTGRPDRLTERREEVTAEEVDDYERRGDTV